MAPVNRFVAAVIVSLIAGTATASGQAGWSGSLSLGRASGDTDLLPRPDSQPSLSLAVYRDVARGTALGVELGSHRFSNYVEHLNAGPSQPESWMLQRGSAWRVTPVVRLQPFGGRVRPYLVLGAGVYGRRTEFARREWNADGSLARDTREVTSRAYPGWLCGLGMDLFPLRWPIGVTAASRLHMPEGDGFLSLELGIVWRRRPPSR
jgi:hypothetical protein